MPESKNSRNNVDAVKNEIPFGVQCEIRWGTFAFLKGTPLKSSQFHNNRVKITERVADSRRL